MEFTFDTGTLMLVFALGGIAGFFIHRLISGSHQDNRALQDKLEELQEQHQQYQDNVNAHFSRTADLIDKLNRNYKEIQTHLMQGAEMLVDKNHELELDKIADDSGSTKEVTEPPRDWAPKEPDQEGTLSESYGLKVSDLKPAKDRAS